MYKKEKNIFSLSSKVEYANQYLIEKIYKEIYEIDIDIDIIDIFCPSSEIFNLVNKIINMKVKTVWLQLEIFCIESEKKLNQLGINFVQNKCTKIEYEKLIK